MNAGGAETFLMKLYRKMDRKRYQMDFCINVKEECFYEQEILGLGGKLYRIPTKSENINEFKKCLTDIIKNEKYEYVLRIASNGASFLDAKIAKKAGAKVVAVRSSNSSDGAGLKMKLAHLIGRFLFERYIDVRIAPSDLAAKYTFGDRNYRNGKVHILHNAIDLDVFKYNEEERKRVRKQLGLTDTSIVYGHVGRFMSQKNHSFLLEVFNEIYKANAEAKLLLVGNGELENEIRNIVSKYDLEDAVVFAGVRQDIPAILSAMDAFVFPSLYEGMPNTVIEAQATGIQCFVADTITREADITGLVRFLPIDNKQTWVECLINYVPVARKDYCVAFENKGYDILSTVKEFTELIMEETND